MTEALLWHQLTQPHGPKGSGRQRYAAAMALYDLGQMSWQMLEAYRSLASADNVAPASTLADRGLVPPLPRPLAPAARFRLLLQECDRYLAARPGPGITEVRQGLAPCFAAEPVVRLAPPNAVVAQWLPAALALLAADDPMLSEAIGLAAPHLHWISYDAYDPAQIGPAFPKAHAFASLIGESHAPYRAQDYDFGLFLIAPHILYRDHAHAAPELYAPLTGPHDWRFAPGAPFHARPAHQPVWNPAHQPHATLTGAAPFLCLFGWTRDVNLPAVVLPSEDWEAYEQCPPR